MDSVIIKLRRFISVVSVTDQIKENDHSDDVSPHVDSFIVEHEQTFKQLPITVKINPKPTFDVNIVAHEGLGV